MLRIARCAILMVLWLACFAAPPAQARCPEPPETDQGGRKGLAQRLFAKKLRHEIHVFGGLYTSDLMGAAPYAGLSYSFHLNEDFALEAGLAWAHFSSSLQGPVEDFTGYTLLESHHAMMYSGALVWHPIYGKFMLFHRFIPHFDIYLSAGLGVTDSRSAKGLTYNLGLGIKIFSTSWMSVRVDLRDHIYVQQLMASETITNNISVTLGAGFWIPFENI